ncbi:hypothetical protein QMA67_12405 [Gluconobacter japonicus]|uniref:hypothetical protein n=1 Tax=Gluconobacter japonicus TaxID=376620 RepID=UPI0024AD9380|nr:hypothetical protein [Gluconobacter japonicus]MDI6653733.1 hypothetical protein [Gluconobacter japonicus]
MSQNTEQNVRTREDQIEAAYLNDSDFTLFQEFDRDDFENQLKEAEARGAAEQRRKDAEGRELVAWQRFSLLTQQWIDVGEDYLDHYRKMGQAIRCLYTRPANVAALDANATKPDGWQPIEGAPKDGTMVDLWVRPIGSGKARRVIDAWWTDRTGWRSGTEIPIDGKVTFWRSCPPGPFLTREGGV